MSGVIKVAGIDPSLRNTGIAKAELDLATGEYIVKKVMLASTESGKSKTVRQNSDDLRCCREIVDTLHREVSDCHAIFAEIPTGAQSARAAFSFGMVVGFMSGFLSTPGLQPIFIQVQPQEVKLSIPGGSKVTSKEEIIEWAALHWPTLDWLTSPRGKFEIPGIEGKLIADNEHMADACAAINAGVKTQEFKNLSAAFRAAFR